MDKYYRIGANLLRTIINIIVVLVNFLRPKLYLKKKPESNSDLCILGNGPSLKDSYNDILLMKNNGSSLMVVNTFADTDEYSLFKPDFYVIADRAFFINTNEERLRTIQKKTALALSEKTNWKLRLFIPVIAKNSDLLKEISKNTNIEVVYFRNTPVYDGFDKVNIFLYKKGLANPPFRNVLIASIFYGLRIGFKKILIWGADHSWHENLYLSGENKLYVKDVHFFKENPEKFMMKKNNGQPMKVHEQLFSIGKALIIYHSLERLSVMMGAKIINRSAKTWIDAFDRE